MVSYLKDHLSAKLDTSYFGRKKLLTRVFSNVLRSEIHKLPILECDIFLDTMALHLIRARNKNHLTKLMVKKLACFFPFYFECRWSKCVNLR